MNKISNQYSLYNFGRFLLLIIMVLVLLLFNTKIYANEKELSETVTKKYDDFTTYYRIANGKDIQVSESDIVYSKDELDN
ncbi:MAG: hypothetical protein LBM02_01190, partial [Lachnospiraceae bacterium]|nr:hypothetical protein [Lachnospiraceae bacterium]